MKRFGGFNFPHIETDFVFWPRKVGGKKASNALKIFTETLSLQASLQFSVIFDKLISK